MIRKEYPLLFKTLSKKFGARKAINIIKIATQYKLAVDAPDLMESFVWSNHELGHGYWSKLNYKLTR